jgi:hypothetical protein
MQQVHIGSSTWYSHWLKDWKYLISYDRGHLRQVVERTNQLNYKDIYVKYREDHGIDDVLRWFVLQKSPSGVRCQCPQC